MKKLPSHAVSSFLSLLSVIVLPMVISGQPPDVGFLPGSEYAAPIERDDGKKGFAAFPAVYSGSKPTRILNPSGFQVHFTDADDPGEELVFAAGELFDPPIGRFRYWLEGEWSMTPFTRLAIFRPNRPAGAKSVTTMPVVPAGRVVLTAEPALDPGHQLRLLYAGGDATGAVRYELSRRKVVAELGDGILMPASPVLGALWDLKKGRYVAISRPFTVQAGKKVPAPLQRPQPEAADLVIYLDLDRGIPGSAVPGLVLTASQGSRQREADLTVTTLWGVYGVWYGLKPGAVVLGGANEQLYVPPVTLRLSGGQIARYQGRLSKQLFTPGSAEPKR